MKKQIKIVLPLLIIALIVIILIYNKVDSLNNKNRLINKSYAIYVKENNSSSYTNSNNIPKGSYVLNEEKSFCENNGKIYEYDNVNGYVTYKTKGSDKCTLYFDEDSIAPIIGDLTVNKALLTAILSDNNNLVGYGLSMINNVEPTSWTQITGTTYNLNITIESEGTYYLWVKDSAGNKTIKEFTISLGTSFTTLMTPNNTDIFEENGIRYEGANPNNYICLDNQKEGTCSSTSLLFRIIGLFDEEYSTNGTNSSGTKKLLKVIDTNNYGGTSGKPWDTGDKNNWSTASLKIELNDTYLTSLINTSTVNSKLSSAIANAKWHLGGSSYTGHDTLTAEGIYKEERNTSAKYSGNPSSIYAKVGLMYPSDYGYATVGGTTTNRTGCRAKPIGTYGGFVYTECGTSAWLYKSQKTSWGSNKDEWVISPYQGYSFRAAYVYSSGYVNLYGDIGSYASYGVAYGQFAVRPTFYLDSDILKVVGGDGSSFNPYHIG